MRCGIDMTMACEVDRFDFHLVATPVPELDAVMRTGAGIACLHYGVEVPIGPSAKGMLAWMGGYFEMNWSVNPHWVASFEVFPGHPAANGVKPFAIDDEWYFHMRFVEGMKGVTPILSAKALAPISIRGPPAQPVAIFQECDCPEVCALTAMGKAAPTAKPVAFATNGTVRLARGFTSST